MIYTLLITAVTIPAVAGLVATQRAQVAASPQGNNSPYALFGFILGLIAIVGIAFVLEPALRPPEAERNYKYIWTIIAVLAISLFLLITAFAAHRS